MSLNIPAIRALQRVGNAAVADQAAKMGLAFQGGKPAFMAAGLAGALGTVEVRPLDLVSAYGTIANGGVHEPARMILEIQDRTGKVVWRAPDAGKRAMSAAAAYQVTDILKGNTNPSVNPIWAAKLAIRNGPGGTRRPAAVKTGTATDARDLRRTGTSRRRPTRRGPRWRSACGWATATIRCRGHRTRPSRSRPPPRCGDRWCASSPTASR